MVQQYIQWYLQTFFYILLLKGKLLLVFGHLQSTYLYYSTWRLILGIQVCILVQLGLRLSGELFIFKCGYWSAAPPPDRLNYNRRCLIYNIVKKLLSNPSMQRVGQQLQLVVTHIINTHLICNFVIKLKLIVETFISVYVE